jgi:hypothetical protein
MKRFSIFLLLFSTDFLYGQNVGIGTTTPEGKLEIKHSSETQASLTITDTSTYFKGWIQFRKPNSSNTFDILGFGEGDAASEAQSLSFRTDSLVDIMTIRGNGNIGINKPDPESKLEIVHHSTIQNKHISLVESEDDYSRIGFKNANGESFQLAAYKGGDLSGSQDSFNIYSTANSSNVLSVNGQGDMSFQRALKPNNQAGTAGQVLQSNGATSSPSWVTLGNSGCMQNLARYVGPATTNGQTSTSWEVPIGVTKIYAEIWGGGGGGFQAYNAVEHKGGGGAGYAASFFSVTPEQEIFLNIGGGGNYGTPTVAGENGGDTEIVVGSEILLVSGGGAANATMTGTPGIGLSTYPAIYTSGNRGSTAKVEYNYNTTTGEYKVVNGCTGGNAGNTTQTGASGSNTYFYNNTLYSTDPSTEARIPGGGGQATGRGGAGLIIIYY